METLGPFSKGRERACTSSACRAGNPRPQHPWLGEEVSCNLPCVIACHESAARVLSQMGDEHLSTLSAKIGSIKRCQFGNILCLHDFNARRCLHIQSRFVQKHLGRSIFFDESQSRVQGNCQFFGFKNHRGTSMFLTPCENLFRERLTNASALPRGIHREHPNGAKSSIIHCTPESDGVPIYQGQPPAIWL